MSDLVEELRKLAAVDNCQASLAAAARIEQLEAALRIAQRGLDPYASYEAQLDARVVVDGICAALGEERT